MGTRIAMAAVSAEALLTRPDTPPAATWAEIKPKAKKPPIMNQAIEATSAKRKGVRDGRCWSAKINPPIEGTSSLAGVREPALRRRARGPPRAHDCFGGVSALWAGASANSSGGFALPQAALAAWGLLALDLGRSGSEVDPSRFRCSARSRSARDARFGKLRSSELSPDFSSRARVIAS